MKLNNKSAIAVTLILLFTLTSTMFALPISEAHSPAWTIPTYAFVATSPTTVGRGQYTLIVMWLDKYPPTAGGLGGDRWRGFQLNITKPDGTSDIVPITGETSQVGAAFTTYTPDQVGDYKIVFSWPGQVLTNGTGVPDNAGVPYVGDTFSAATSDPAILHVQEAPVTDWVEPPIPTDYWTRPISTANREWTVLASNWLKGSWQRYPNFQENGQAPNAPHILWTKPIIDGGISDTSYKAVAMDTTDYENAFPGPIIMNGRVYYNTGTYPNYGYYAVDLRTGQQIWYKNGTDNGLNNPVTLYDNGGGGNFGPWLAQNFPQLSFGQLYHNYQANGEGVKDHLWMTQTNDPNNNWYMLDANTGNWVLTLTHVPSGTSVTDQDGSPLLYSYNTNTGLFLCWNVSQSIPPPSPTGTAQQQWEPRTGAIIDAVNDTSWTQYGPQGGGGATGWGVDDIRPRSGYTMNVTGPKGLPPLSRVLQDSTRNPTVMIFSDFYNNPSFGSGTDTFRVAAVRIDYHVAPYSPQPDKSNTQNNNLGYGVTLLYDKTITKPAGGNLTFSLGPMSWEDKIFTVWSKETRQWWGYNIDDGSYVWGPTASQPSWDMYGQGSLFAYGKLISGYFGGIVYAYDIKTGKQVWNYTATGIGHESPYGNYDVGYGGKYASDGKIFIRSFEHSPSQPMWRGSYLRAINATTGAEIWKIQNMVLGLGIADGYIVAASEYDDLIYCIGKGPSTTTVEAPSVDVTTGHTMVIKGTVTDQSPGAKAQAMARGNTVPAISDADQQAYMEYLYEQQAKPTNAKGVQVTLTALDPNGNVIPIGTTTSDMNGNYGFGWTVPDVTGSYTIMASFAGSESYFSSQASTYAVVSSAAATHEATPTPAPMTDTYVIGLGAAAIIAIIIIGLIIVLMLRKRP